MECLRLKMENPRRRPQVPPSVRRHRSVEFRSPGELVQAIREHIEAGNGARKPFTRAKSADEILASAALSLEKPYSPVSPDLLGKPRLPDATGLPP